MNGPVPAYPALCVLALGSLALAQTSQSIVLPANAAGVEGGISNAFPWGQTAPSFPGLRVQAVYDSSNLTSQGVTGPIAITGIRWRCNGGTAPLGGTFGFATVALASAAVDYTAVSTNWAANQNPDHTVVYSGAVAVIPSAASTPGAWYVDVQLSTPFSYDPTTGDDLIIDTDRPLGNWSGAGSARNDVAGAGSSSSRVYGSSAYPQANGITFDHGVVVELSYSAAGGTTLPDPRGTVVPTVLDSGTLANPTNQALVVWSQIVTTPNARWMQASFSTIALAPGSTLRMTSLLDQEVQEFDRFMADIWSRHSAFFNGNQLRLELIAAPQSTGNRVVLANVLAELGGAGNCDDGPCGACNPDGRVLSNMDWSGRWPTPGCTASIYNENGCYVTAGHCWVPTNPVMLFRVPASLFDCTRQMPAVEDQFPVITSVRDFPGNDCAPDWRCGKIGPNSIGQTHKQRYGVWMPLAAGPPPVSSTIHIYGFGKSSDPFRDAVQQLTVATVTSTGGSTISYSGGTTTGGTSGGGVIYDNTIVGINTCCNLPGCLGLGSRIDQSAFVTARQQMCPHTVHAPWDVPFCLNQTQSVVPITVCNTGAIPDSYLLTFAGLAPGPNCSVQGPTSYTVIGPNPVGPIAPGDCLTVNVGINRPVGFTAAKLSACYDVTATSQNTSAVVTDRGSFIDRRDICSVLVGWPNTAVTLAVGVADTVRFAVTNTGEPNSVLRYRVEAFAPDMEPSGAIMLDGNYPGVASEGTINLPLNTTGTIDINVLYRWLEPSQLSDLVLSIDTNGNNVFEPVASVGMRSVDFPAQATPYGLGCPGTNGTPGNNATTLPVVGVAFGAEVINAVPSGLTLIALGFSDTVYAGLPLPFDLAVYGAPGCTALASADAVLFGLADPTGTLPYGVAIPNNATLLGSSLYTQGWVLDPINQLGLVTTNGIAATIGQ